MAAVLRTLWEGSAGIVLAAADDHGVAYSIGYVFGIMLVIGIPVALIVRAVTRRSNRNAVAYGPPSAPRAVGSRPTPDAVWDGTRWLRWDGVRWQAWDGTMWRFWDGTQWISPAPAPPPSGEPMAPPFPPPS